MAFCSVKVYRVFSLFAQSACGAVRLSAVKSAPETSARRLIQTGTVAVSYTHLTLPTIAIV